MKWCNLLCHRSFVRTNSAPYGAPLTAGSCPRPIHCRHLPRKLMQELSPSQTGPGSLPASAGPEPLNQSSCSGSDGIMENSHTSDAIKYIPAEDPVQTKSRVDWSCLGLINRDPKKR
ncbi:unnamed protein product [Menidia menidia]|uniref:(Atlantic silverside) hypothetical protein n=1 Tax=Menidia menidia TaxID=238744 RepID=A0A8S4AKA2_9TELE|nr:unnamed protein product [Menidia menidia]